MRAITIALACLIAILVLADPYTLHLNASDMVMPAPLWQIGLGLFDVGLLLAVAILAARHLFRLATIVAGIALPYAVVVALLLVQRDGLDRFIAGFGAQPTVAWFLVVLLLRIALVYCTRWASVRQNRVAR
jgi:hypothetical protein